MGLFTTVQVGSCEVGGKMSSLGGKEGLDRRWAGHDALTKIESVGTPQELGLSSGIPILQNQFLFGICTSSSW